MRKRSRNIATTLVKNAISATYCAIEIHNKPNISFRYETVTLLIFNAWELVIKAYIHKNHKSYKLIDNDWRHKKISKLLDYLKTQISENDFLAIYHNLNKIIEYRNNITHFYIEWIDSIIFSLISCSISLFEEFIWKFFNKTLVNKKDNLMLLPLGFRKPFSPFDYLSEQSSNAKMPKEVQDFFHGFFLAQEELNAKSIKDWFVFWYNYHLQSVSKSEADMVIWVDNTRENLWIFTIQKNVKLSSIHITNEESAPKYQLSDAEILVYYPLKYADLTKHAKGLWIKFEDGKRIIEEKIKKNPKLAYSRRFNPSNLKWPVNWFYSKDAITEINAHTKHL